MRILRSHHIKNLIEVLDVFLPRAAANPKGGRPVTLHPNDVLGLLCYLAAWSLRSEHSKAFTSGPEPSTTAGSPYRRIAAGCASAARHWRACFACSTSYS